MTNYISTRGGVPAKKFSDVLLEGLAPDGGLYVPDQWPELDNGLLNHMQGLQYSSIAHQIVRPFIGDSIPEDALVKILTDTYALGTFDSSAIAPLVQVGPNAWILELFHGPTFSFKDYALQVVGRLFDYMLDRQKKRLTIIGATSGDTGSAAIEACRECRNVDIFILYPQGRTSEVQRRQMTTVDAPNVHTIAIDGTFDDCQGIVKTLFADEKLRGDLNLSAVNSINWARIMLQMVYYAAAAMALGAPGRGVSFAVPTGNFGNVYAAWAARRIGVPVQRLFIGTNRNDILTRFFETGAMTAEKVVPSLSPSMDIQISSNFERYLFDLLGRDHDALKNLMKDFSDKKSFSVSSDILKKAQADFSASRCTDADTLAMMKGCFDETGILIDPHTAVGLNAAMQGASDDPATPVVALACAHPAKFPDAVKQAIGMPPSTPARLAAVMKRAERFTPISADAARVASLIRQLAGK